MDDVTARVSEYVTSRGISIRNLSEALDIPYGAMYDSLSQKNGNRKLRAGEFLKICSFLNIDPKYFASKKE